MYHGIHAKRGKKQRKDVQYFEQNLMANIITLHQDLVMKRYRHSEYEAFNISDPKPRNIHKASVRDRLLHHAIYRILYPYFDTEFIHDSYSCRLNKGTHKAINRFREFAYVESQNHSKTLWLLGRIIGSFHSTQPGKGLPLGNLTSQLLVNIYMNEFDQFVKRELKAEYYIRYADDFVFLSADKDKLGNMLSSITLFLRNGLKLELHPDKVFIKSFASGVDFLGWVNFSDHRVVRSVTKRRAIRGIRAKEGNVNTLQSYLGLLKHGNTYKLVKSLL